VQRRGTQPAVPINLTLLLQQAGHREISTEYGQSPLTDLHLTSQIGNRPCFSSDGREEVQLESGNQNPWQPVSRDRIAEVIECGDLPTHRPTPIVLTHQRIKS